MESYSVRETSGGSSAAYLNPTSYLQASCVMLVVQESEEAYSEQRLNCISLVNDLSSGLTAPQVPVKHPLKTITEVGNNLLEKHIYTDLVFFCAYSRMTYYRTKPGAESRA